MSTCFAGRLVVLIRVQLDQQLPEVSLQVVYCGALLLFLFHLRNAHSKASKRLLLAAFHAVSTVFGGVCHHFFDVFSWRIDREGPFPPRASETTSQTMPMSMFITVMLVSST